ncbi:unnamed protein product [Caenorhabditis bovis]|uniref:Uncharacterized protein n=1 Tax=Caenorhabditis bovis TaxID=2654633 RepID=A0A8S1ESP8_9PELO|nr:unnamed protein product [Caenorhabditis bovis]
MPGLAPLIAANQKSVEIVISDEPPPPPSPSPRQRSLVALVMDLIIHPRIPMVFFLKLFIIVLRTAVMFTYGDCDFDKSRQLLKFYSEAEFPIHINDATYLHLQQVHISQQYVDDYESSGIRMTIGSFTVFIIVSMMIAVDSMSLRHCQFPARIAIRTPIFD